MIFCGFHYNGSCWELIVFKFIYIYIYIYIYVSIFPNKYWYESGQLLKIRIRVNKIFYERLNKEEILLQFSLD